MKGLVDNLVEQANLLDQQYFGDRSIERSVEVINAQADSMSPTSIKSNVYEQAGDLLFALISLARNQNWSLERLLQDAINKVERRRTILSALVEAFLLLISSNVCWHW